MPFDSGPITFTLCHLSQELGSSALERFAEYAAKSLKGVMEEPQYGWVSWRHLLETRIDDETAYLGGYMYLNMRTAVRKVPASLLKAQVRMEELAWMQANNVNYIGRKQKNEIKQHVASELMKTMPPSITGIPIVYDSANDLMYLGCTSQGQIDSVFTQFYAAHKFEPHALDAAGFVEHFLGRSADGLPMLDFSESANGGGEPVPGRDFLTWLWYNHDTNGATIKVDGLGEFAYTLDGPFVFAAEDESATQESSVRKGMVAASAEAKAAVTVGKKLKRSQIILVRDRQQWQFTFDADSFTFRGMKLPDGEELDLGSAFQERMMNLTVFRKAFVALLEQFVTLAEDDAALQAEVPRFHKWVAELEGK